MKKILHIIATPRGKDSRTLKVSSAFLDAFKVKYPDAQVDELNLYQAKLPSISVKMIDGKFVLLGGHDLSPELKQAWTEIEKVIKRFLSADAYLISTPMWNFNVPYLLKQYIDLIIQPRYMFRYTANGPEGMIKNKKMVVITSRGGDYSEGPSAKFDFQEPYLRTIFGLTGLTDITFINAQPMDAMGFEVQAKKIEIAKEQAKLVAEEF
jgi:FMN-dependent NADH-azoreductase